MGKDNDASNHRPNLGQIYLIVLLLTAVGAIVAGLLSMYSVMRSFAADELREHVRHVLANWPLILPLLAITVTGLVLRFIRWHFLLRCLNVRVALGTSLLAFYAGVPMVLTPAYIGELISAFVLNRLSGASVFRGITAVIAGRVHDLIAILILLALLSNTGHGLIVLVVVIGAATVGWVLSPVWTAGLTVLLRRLRRVPILRWLAPASSVDAAILLAPRSFVPCLIISLMGWYLIGLVLVLAVFVGGVQPDVDTCVQVFLEGTLHGAKSLSPAGIGYTSHFMWHALIDRLGMDELVALEASTLTRFAITGLTIVVGFGVFFFVFNRHRRLLAAADRFDALSARYDEELAEYVLARLLERKTERMIRFLQRDSDNPSGLIGADIGCGTGGYAARMAQTCARVFAMDAAEGQVRQAATRGQPNTSHMTAKLPHLPLADASVDFAYSINVFHHLPNQEVQRQAFTEVARVLKPGGVFFIHEINTINPLFRFYMGYIFPVLHQLDDGSELWLTPDDVEALTDMTVEGGEYFTFLPEFTPRVWQTAFGFLESWLEQSRLRRYSAHYMLICRKA